MENFPPSLKSQMSNGHDGLSSISHFKSQLINQEYFHESFYFQVIFSETRKISIELMVKLQNLNREVP